MPLLTKTISLGQDGEEQHPVYVQQRKEEVREEKDKDSGYEDFEEYVEEECVDSDMEGSIMQRGRPKKPVKVPALPQRSEKRASKLLENVMIELQNLDGSRQKEADKISLLQESDPHELYLSSEEDASFSDDYEDSLSEYEAASPEDPDSIRASSSRASSRKSQEDTARAVSIISVGKPQIVNIFVPNTSPSRTQNRRSLTLEKPASFNSRSTSYIPASTRRPTPLKLYPTIRRMSISSMVSSHSSSPTSTASTTTHPFAASTTNLDLTATSSTSNLPLRKSSRLAANLTSLVTNTRTSLQSASNSFLTSDPFATSSSTSTALNSIPYPKNREEEGTPIEAKTPTSTAAAGWKKGLSKTLHKARRPSMPKLSLAYTAGVVPPRPNSNASSSTFNPALSPEDSEKEGETEKVSSEPEAEAPSQNSSHSSSPETTIVEEKQKSPVRYEDIIKGAGAIVKSPAIPNPKERRAMVFGRLVRSRSTKGRSGAAQNNSDPPSLTPGY